MAIVKRTTVVQNVPTQPVTTTIQRTSVSSPGYMMDKFIQLMYVLFAILNVLLLSRFILLTLGANRVDIVNFIYNLTGPFVAPFIGIFGRTTIFNGGYFEYEALIAILFYSFIAWAIGGLIDLFNDR